MFETKGCLRPPPQPHPRPSGKTCRRASGRCSGQHWTSGRCRACRLWTPCYPAACGRDPRRAALRIPRPRAPGNLGRYLLPLRHPQSHARRRPTTRPKPRPDILRRSPAHLPPVHRTAGSFPPEATDTVERLWHHAISELVRRLRRSRLRIGFTPHLTRYIEGYEATQIERWFQ